MRLVLEHARAMTIELARYPAYVVPTLVLPTVFFLFFAAPGGAAGASVRMATFAGFAAIGRFFSRRRHRRRAPHPGRCPATRRSGQACDSPPACSRPVFATAAAGCPAVAVSTTPRRCLPRTDRRRGARRRTVPSPCGIALGTGRRRAVRCRSPICCTSALRMRAGCGSAPAGCLRELRASHASCRLGRSPTCWSRRRSAAALPGALGPRSPVSRRSSRFSPRGGTAATRGGATGDPALLGRRGIA